MAAGNLKREAFVTIRDNLHIHGWIYGRTGEKKPAVILSHGFLANQKMCTRYAEELSALGYITVTYDFCGGGLFCSSEGKSQDMTVFTEVKDLFGVYAEVAAMEDVQKERITLLGCSQGGYVSAIAAAEHPECFERLVLFYPALCIPDDARNGHMMFYRFDPHWIPEVLGRFPMKLGGGYARCVIDKDPMKQIAGYPGKVLIVHGDQDKIVHVSYAERAKECYGNAELKIIPGGRHMFRGRCDDEAVKVLKEFMQR